MLPFFIKQQQLFQYLVYRVTFWKGKKGKESMGPQLGGNEILHIFSALCNVCVVILDGK